MKRPFRKFIGNYLLEDNALTLKDLDRALARQLELGFRDQPMKLGDVLIELGLITRAQLERALERQARERGE
jgi:hypothetical protein